MKLKVKFRQYFCLFLLVLFFYISLNSLTVIAFDESEVKSEMKTAFKSREENLQFEFEQGRNQISPNLINQLLEKAQQEIDDYYQKTISGWNFEISGTEAETELDLEVDYLSDETEDYYVFNRVEEIAEEITATSRNEDEKIKAVNDFVMQFEYDDNLIYETAYDALTEGKTTCLGYTLITYLLLEEMGIENQIVVGDLLGQPEMHAWNLVKIANNYYHLDTTQNAAHYHQEDEILRFAWYNISDQVLTDTHAWDESNYPSAKNSYFEHLLSLKENNPEKTDVYQDLIYELKLNYKQNKYTAANESDVRKKLKDALEKKAEEITFRSQEEFFDPDYINHILQEIQKEKPGLSELNSFELEGISYPLDDKETIIMTIKLIYN